MKIIAHMKTRLYASKSLAIHGICPANGIIQHQDAGLRQMMFLGMIQ